MKIDLSRYESVWRELKVENTTNVNHENCPSGIDTRKRLYITRTKNSVICYCHNCGSHGYKQLGKRLLSYDEATCEKHRAAESTTTECSSVPKDVWFAYSKARMNIEEFDIDQKLWLYSYGITESSMRRYDIRSDSDTVYIRLDNALVCRNFNRHTRRRPKYLMYRNSATKQQDVCYPIATKDEGVLFIVEDAISAIKVSQAGYKCMCLLGTHLTDASLAWIASHNHTKVIVWTDDDFAGHKAAMDISRRLEPVVPGIVKYMLKGQPKEYTEKEIFDVV